jgi:hypothetical protein
VASGKVDQSGERERKEHASHSRRQKGTVRSIAEDEVMTICKCLSRVATTLVDRSVEVARQERKGSDEFDEWRNLGIEA